MAEPQVSRAKREHRPRTAAPPAPRSAGEDWFVQSTASTHRLFVRCKAGRRQAGAQAPAPMVFVHGATFAGSAVYDADLPGGSWLDFAAAQGHDAFAMDVRGYGKSSQPPALAEASFHNQPQVNTADAVADLRDVVDAVRRRTGAAQVNLVGWSWGTSICGGYATQFPDAVRAMTLFAPLWVLRDFLGFPITRSPMWPVAWLYPMIARSPYWVGAWRDVDAAHARKRQGRGVSRERMEKLLPQAEFERWWSALEAEGYASAAAPATPSLVRAPNGVVADILGCWANGTPTWDPARVLAPTQLVVGAQDIDTPPSMAREIYQALTQAANRQLLILDHGTHWMTLQVNRFELYRSVQNFMDRPCGLQADVTATNSRND